MPSGCSCLISSVDVLYKAFCNCVSLCLLAWWGLLSYLLCPWITIDDCLLPHPFDYGVQFLPCSSPYALYLSHVPTTYPFPLVILVSGVSFCTYGECPSYFYCWQLPGTFSPCLLLGFTPWSSSSSQYFPLGSLPRSFPSVEYLVVPLFWVVLLLHWFCHLITRLSSFLLPHCSSTLR